MILLPIIPPFLSSTPTHIWPIPQPLGTFDLFEFLWSAWQLNHRYSYYSVP